ncbi:hypothetical protein KY285_030340 [Solanum tuberosum]|nr:hypothetical protein KY285_030340 [Solanum tuberosum]
MESIEYQIDTQNIEQTPMQTNSRQLFVTSNAICLRGMDPIVDGHNVEIEETEIINDPQNDVMVEGQVYVEKHVLSTVMQKYALLREFRFTIVRSSTIR